MLFVAAAIKGSLRDVMRAEVRDVARGLRRAAERAGRQTQEALRAEARAAGFRDAGRAIASAWRLRIYPDPGVAPDTFKPAALVFSKMPQAVAAFDRAEPIASRSGAWLAIPTAFNLRPGRAGTRRGLRVTPAEMMRARGEAFTVPSKRSPGTRLWCLRVREARGLGRRGRNRIRLFVGDAAEVLTGHRKGQQAAARATLAKGFVPMFVLVRQVRPRKRIDLAGARARAAGTMLRAMAEELRR